MRKRINHALAFSEALAHGVVGACVCIMTSFIVDCLSLFVWMETFNTSIFELCASSTTHRIFFVFFFATTNLGVGTNILAILVEVLRTLAREKTANPKTPRGGRKATLFQALSPINPSPNPRSREVLCAYRYGTSTAQHLCATFTLVEVWIDQVHSDKTVQLSDIVLAFTIKYDKYIYTYILMHSATCSEVGFSPRAEERASVVAGNHGICRPIWTADLAHVV